MTQSEFEEILSGQKVMGNLDQSWAIARVLENLHYYDAIHLIPYQAMLKNWDIIKKKIFNHSLRSGYEFVLHRYPLSITG